MKCSWLQKSGLILKVAAQNKEAELPVCHKSPNRFIWACSERQQLAPPQFLSHDDGGKNFCFCVTWLRNNGCKIPVRVTALTYSNKLNDGHGEVVLVRHVCVHVLLVDAVRGEAEQRQQRHNGEAEVELHQRRQLRPGLYLQVEETEGIKNVKQPVGKQK